MDLQLEELEAGVPCGDPFVDEGCHAIETEVAVGGAEALEEFQQETKPLLSGSHIVTSVSSPVQSGSVTALLSAFRRVEPCLSSTKSEQSQRAVPSTSSCSRERRGLDTDYSECPEKRRRRSSRDADPVSAVRAAILREKAELERQLQELRHEGPRNETSHRERRPLRREAGEVRRQYLEDSEATEGSSEDERRYGRRSGRALDSVNSDDSMEEHLREVSDLLRAKRKLSKKYKQDRRLRKRPRSRSPSPQDQRPLRTRFADRPSKTVGTYARRPEPLPSSRSLRPWRPSPSPGQSRPTPSTSLKVTSAQQKRSGNRKARPLSSEEDDNNFVESTSTTRQKSEPSRQPDRSNAKEQDDSPEPDDSAGTGQGTQTQDCQHSEAKSLSYRKFYAALSTGNTGKMLECLFTSVEAMQREIAAIKSCVREEIATLRWMVLQNSNQPTVAEARMIYDLPDEFTFPLSTVEEVAELEEKLTDSAFKRDMVTALAATGGNDIKRALWGIMKRLFTSNLAMKYNYTGAKGKLCFQDLILRRVVFEAVKRLCPKAGDYDIYLKLSAWLTTARDRDGGKKRRLLASMEAEERLLA